MAAGSPAIDRVIDIFEAFRLHGRPLSLTELAEMTQMPKSTCHAIVATLAARGYLYTLSRPRALYPTRRMYDVTHDIQRSDALVARLAPWLEQLRDETGETVILGKRQGDAVVYLQVVESRQSIRYSAAPGDLKPLHSSSIGKALLGAQKEDAMRAWLAGRELPAVTPATRTDAARLAEEIVQSRRQGFFQTRGENVSDVWAVAAFFQARRETLAIAVAGPRHRMEQALLSCAKQLVATCSVAAREAR